MKKLKKINFLFIPALAFMVFSGSIFSNETVSVYTSKRSNARAFILFYMSSCIHCRRFEPVLVKYSNKHHIPILAYTLDGKTLQGLPKSFTPSKEELNRFFPSHHPVVPTLFMMNEYNHTIVPVLQGEATEAQLEERIERLYEETDVYDS